jgi:hypothetical protein
VHGQLTVGGPDKQPQLVDPVGRAGAGRRPGDVGQQAEDAVQVGLVRPDQPVREQVQPQVCVGGAAWRVGQRVDHGAYLDGT